MTNTMQRKFLDQRGVKMNVLRTGAPVLTLAILFIIAAIIYIDPSPGSNFLFFSYDVLISLMTILIILSSVLGWVWATGFLPITETATRPFRLAIWVLKFCLLPFVIVLSCGVLILVFLWLLKRFI